MSFKEQVKSDINKIFLDVHGFAEYRSIWYEGELYEHIPVVMNTATSKERETRQGDYGQGIYQQYQTLHCNLDDIGGKPPIHGSRIRISDVDPVGRDQNFYNGRGLNWHYFYIDQVFVELGKVKIIMQAKDE